MPPPSDLTSAITGNPGAAALRQIGDTHVWLHASPWHALLQESGKRILVAGKGCMVKDIDGNEYLDGLAGLWLVNVGHGRQEIAAAMAEQAAKLAYASSTQATTVPAIQLAARLADFAAPAKCPFPIP